MFKAFQVLSSLDKNDLTISQLTFAFFYIENVRKKSAAVCNRVQENESASSTAKNIKKKKNALRLICITQKDTTAQD